MYANYHTHSYHCNHASGTPEQYVQAAMANGIRILGFSDHVPCDFSTGHRSHFRMDSNHTATYVEEVLALKKRYQGQIDIYLGYEAEYYPDEFLNVMQHILPYPCDYLILGQHFTHNEYDGVYAGGKKANTEANLCQYVDQVIAAMDTGLFSCVNHPDLAFYDGDEAVYRREMSRLCEVAKARQVPLEINLLGLSSGRHYPDPRFWQIAGEMGAPVILGRDAHQPEAFYDRETLNRAEALITGFHLNVQDTMILRPVGKGSVL